MLKLDIESEVICNALQIDEAKLNELALEYQKMQNDNSNELESEVEE